MTWGGVGGSGWDVGGWRRVGAYGRGGVGVGVDSRGWGWVGVDGSGWGWVGKGVWVWMCVCGVAGGGRKLTSNNDARLSRSSFSSVAEGRSPEATELKELLALKKEQENQANAKRILHAVSRSARPRI